MKKEILMELISLALNESQWEVKKEVELEELPTDNIWKYVILRGYNSWVHFWKLEFASKNLYRLSDSRRLWYWNNIKGLWLSSVALYWLANDSKVCWAIDIEITDDNISEIIPCSKKSIKSIQWLDEHMVD